MSKKMYRLGLLLLFLSLDFLSCNIFVDDLPPKKYPESLTLDGYGVLTYERTILDDIPLFCAVKSGSDIVALSETAVYVIDAPENRIKKTVKLEFGRNESVFYPVEVICQFGKYLVVSQVPRGGEGDDDCLWFHIIDSITLASEKINITQYLFNMYSEKIEYIRYIHKSDRNTFVLAAWEDSTYTDLYYETSDFIEWTKIEKDEVVEKAVMLHDKPTENGITYFIDDRSALYSDTYLCASGTMALAGTRRLLEPITDEAYCWMVIRSGLRVLVIMSRFCSKFKHDRRWPA